MKINPKKLQIPLSALLFLGLMFLYVFIYQETKKNNKEAYEVNVKLKDQEQKNISLLSLNKSIESIKKDEELLNTHFAHSGDIVPFLDTIEGLARKVGTEAEITSVDALPENSGLIINLKATGSFEKLYTLITLLENSTYKLEFTFLDMQKEDTGAIDTKDKKKSLWQANFKVKLLTFLQ